MLPTRGQEAEDRQGCSRRTLADVEGFSVSMEAFMVATPEVGSILSLTGQALQDSVSPYAGAWHKLVSGGGHQGLLREQEVFLLSWHTGLKYF